MASLLKWPVWFFLLCEEWLFWWGPCYCHNWLSCNIYIKMKNNFKMIKAAHKLSKLILLWKKILPPTFYCGMILVNKRKHKRNSITQNLKDLFQNWGLEFLSNHNTFLQLFFQIQIAWGLGSTLFILQWTFLKSIGLYCPTLLCCHQTRPYD